MRTPTDRVLPRQGYSQPLRSWGAVPPIRFFRRHEHIGLALCLFVALFFLRLPWLDEPRWNDASVFETVARRVLQGDSLYTEVFDHKPPGIYCVYVVAIGISNVTSLGVPVVARLLDSAAVAVALALLASLGRDRLSRWWFAAGAAVVLSGWDVYSGSALAETWALLAAAFALCSARLGNWGRAGVGIGCAVAFSVAGILVVPAIVAQLPGFGWRQRSGRMALGLLLPAGAATAIVFATGTNAWDAWDALVVYNLQHAAAPEFPTSIGLARTRMFYLLIHTGMLALVLPMAFPARRWTRGELWALVQVAVSAAYAVSLVTGGRVYGQAAFVAFALALAAAAVLSSRSRLLTLGAVAALALFTRYTVQLEPWMLLRTDGEVTVAARVRESDGPVWVWGHFAGPVLEGGNTPAYRYFFNLPLLHYGGAARLAKTIAEVEGQPPTLIIDECRVSGGPDPCIADVDSGDLRALLAEYDRENVGKFIVYKRRTE